MLDVAGLRTDIFQVTARHVAILEERIAAWEIDLATFILEVVRRGRGPAADRVRRFTFVEGKVGTEPGFAKFLADPSLSGTATAAELEFLRGLHFHGRRPSALYYYRELQNLRDPLHFEE
ncbi:MAG: helix-turn-helix domain-containing protein, partial [Gemmatimonadales bacterium]